MIRSARSTGFALRPQYSGTLIKRLKQIEMDRARNGCTARCRWTLISDLVWAVLTFLDVASVASMDCVCQDFHSLVDDLLWEDLCRMHFSCVPFPARCSDFRLFYRAVVEKVRLFGVCGVFCKTFSDEESTVTLNNEQLLCTLTQKHLQLPTDLFSESFVTRTLWNQRYSGIVAAATFALCEVKVAEVAEVGTHHVWNFYEKYKGDVSSYWDCDYWCCSFDLFDDVVEKAETKQEREDAIDRCCRQGNRRREHAEAHAAAEVRYARKLRRQKRGKGERKHMAESRAAHDRKAALSTAYLEEVARTCQEEEALIAHDVRCEIAKHSLKNSTL